MIRRDTFLSFFQIRYIKIKRFIFLSLSHTHIRLSLFLSQISLQNEEPKVFL